MDAPHRWLPGLVHALDRELRGELLHAGGSGPLWLHLKLEQRQLFLFAQPSLRLAWLSAQPLPRALWQLLDQHEQSPFRAHLAARRCLGVQLLVDAAQRPDGLALLLEDGRLAIRWHPRPGAIWLEDADGQFLAQQGNLDGEPLAATTGEPTDFDLDRHARESRTELEDQLAATLRQRIERARRERERRARRLVLKLESELQRAQQELALRAAADALAARLHEFKQLPASLELRDFEGHDHRLELDPALSPARNLDLLYKRCAKAERSVERVQARIRETENSMLADVALDALSLAQLIERAQAEAVDLVTPEQRSAGERRDRAAQERLPYRRLILPSGRELRIGRSARDNDVLLRDHSHGQDLWLHAQGVQGSHVLLRHGPKAPSAQEIEWAARVAAHHSKARTSSLVPVLVTERRYVRKPRKSPPGTVVAERTRTLFVQPGLPPTGADDEFN